MNIDEVQPAQCYTRAQRLWSEIRLLETELGRTEDQRPIPEVTNAQPREVYFEALAVWNKLERLASEVGTPSARQLPRSPSPHDCKPGHVLQVIDGALVMVEELKQRFQIDDRAREPAIEPMRTPSDVLVTLLRASRDVSKLLERPYTPGDVYRVVSLASAYAGQLGGRLVGVPHEKGKRPNDCYVQLERCLQLVTSVIAKQGHPCMSQRGTIPEVVSGDVYDLASLVMGELAFLHSLGNHPAVQPYEAAGCSYRLPSHVFQLCRVLEAQLVVL